MTVTVTQVPASAGHLPGPQVDEEVNIMIPLNFASSSPFATARVDQVTIRVMMISEDSIWNPDIYLILVYLELYSVKLS